MKKWRGKFSLPALLISAMLPDLEIPVVLLVTGGIYNRLILHSFLGAVILGTSTSALLTIFIYPQVVSTIFGLDKRKVKEKCSFSGVLVFSCFIGSLSHVLIDSLHHSFNPLLYPFVKESFDAFVIRTSFASSSDLVAYPMLVILMLLLVWEIRKGKEGFWQRVLVE